MAQLPIELILVRELAARLAVPIFVVDAAGDLLFINEAAERLLGMRFDELGDVPFAEWAVAFAPRSAGGRAVDGADLPLAVAIRERRPAHGRLRIRAQDGASHSIEVTAIPLEGPHGQVLGGVAMFWERPVP